MGPRSVCVMPAGLAAPCAHGEPGPAPSPLRWSPWEAGAGMMVQPRALPVANPSHRATARKTLLVLATTAAVVLAIHAVKPKGLRER
jgi:hypothetical protein